MYILKKIFYSFLLLTFMLMTGCALTYAPSGWLPDKDEIPSNAAGGWITIVTEDSSGKNGINLMQYGGELIAVDAENVYLLYDSLYTISKKDITKSTLELDDKNTALYALWTLLGIPSTILNGYFLVFTAPLWVIGGIPVVIDDSFRDRYETVYPDNFYWNDIIIFSRFPQGVEGINLDELQPIFQMPIDRRVK